MKGNGRLHLKKQLPRLLKTSTKPELIAKKPRGLPAPHARFASYFFPEPQRLNAVFWEMQKRKEGISKQDQLVGIIYSSPFIFWDAFLMWNMKFVWSHQRCQKYSFINSILLFCLCSFFGSAGKREIVGVEKEREKGKEKKRASSPQLHCCTLICSFDGNLLFAHV